MITYYILDTLIGAINSVFAYLPSGSALPSFFGINLDEIFYSGVQYFRLLTNIFPPFSVIAIAATTYLGWRLVLIGIRVFLGSRTPAHR